MAWGWLGFMSGISFGRKENKLATDSHRLTQTTTIFLRPDTRPKKSGLPFGQLTTTKN